MKNIIEKCKTTRILGAIGIIGLILGSIMPYVKYDFWGYSYSVTLVEFWQGKFIIILAIANLLFIFKDVVEKYIPALFNSEIGRKIQECDNQKYSLIPTVLSTIFAIYLTSTMGTSSFGYYNIGFYAMWIGTISLVAYALIHKKDNV
jgi:hypothetical protein